MEALRTAREEALGEIERRVTAMHARLERAEEEMRSRLEAMSEALSATYREGSTFARLAQAEVDRVTAAAEGR